MEHTKTRVAVIAIIVREGASVTPLNELLHQYGGYIIGRMPVLLVTHDPLDLSTLRARCIKL